MKKSLKKKKFEVVKDVYIYKVGSGPENQRLATSSIGESSRSSHSNVELAKHRFHELWLDQQSSDECQRGSKRAS